MIQNSQFMIQNTLLVSQNTLIVNHMTQSTRVYVICNIYGLNMIPGQLKIGEHQTKCGALTIIMQMKLR